MAEMTLCKSEYEENTARTRDARMAWWRDARFGMFVHYGLYSQVGRMEWVMALENMPIGEYEKLADSFSPKPGAPREWAALAKKAGMKYMVMTTRHHEGFSLWDSKANPYNSMNYGPKRDLVREYVDACREFGLRIGFYSSLMDWHHPDSWRCAFDSEARIRFTRYIQDINRELMTNYGKIDILWYDVPQPMETAEGWNSLELNQMVRDLQPDIVINNRSRLDEDFRTPEGHLTPSAGDWEACMTFNDMSWGYVDSAQAAPYSYTPQRILKMLNMVSAHKGNLLLNIGPKPDGSVPDEAVGPLTTVGNWLAENATAVYGKRDKAIFWSSGVGGTSRLGNTIFFWNFIWPANGTIAFGGFITPVKKITMLRNGTAVKFEQRGQRVILKDLPPKSPDQIAGIAVIAIEFTDEPDFHDCSYYPQRTGGRDWAGDSKI